MVFNIFFSVISTYSTVSKESFHQLDVYPSSCQKPLVPSCLMTRCSFSFLLVTCYVSADILTTPQIRSMCVYSTQIYWWLLQTTYTEENIRFFSVDSWCICDWCPFWTSSIKIFKLQVQETKTFHLAHASWLRCWKSLRGSADSKTFKTKAICFLSEMMTSTHLFKVLSLRLTGWEIFLVNQKLFMYHHAFNLGSS